MKKEERIQKRDIKRKWRSVNYSFFFFFTIAVFYLLMMNLSSYWYACFMSHSVMNTT